MSQFTNALDIWSLGILVHEVLTSKRPFFDQAAYDEDSGKISGVVSSSTTKPLTQANSPLLFGYYYGNIEFPVDDLVTSGASPEAICFVRGLLAANPEDRPTALEAFKDVWLHIDHPEYTRMDDWLKSLESELSVLGIDLKLKEDQKQNLWERRDGVDIVQLMSVPEKEAYSSLLEQAVAKGLILLVPMLLRSANYQQESTNRLSLEYLFHKAVKSRRTDMIQLLQSKGADIGALIEGKSALYLAAERGDSEIAKVLLELGLNNDAKTNTQDHQTALQVAALCGHLGVVQLLLSHKVDVNSTGYPPNRQTAIQAAASSGNIHIVELMLDHGAEINGPLDQEEGRTALQAAAQFGNDVRIIKLLLERGAEINAYANPSNYFGRTALQAACEVGNIEMVRLLL
jgi:ankyrin repeat protein